MFSKYQARKSQFEAPEVDMGCLKFIFDLIVGIIGLVVGLVAGILGLVLGLGGCILGLVFVVLGLVLVLPIALVIWIL